MEWFQEYLVITLLALVFASVIAKLVSVVLYGGDDKAVDDAHMVKGVEREVKLDNKGLRVKSTKIKKRVKFADDVVVKHVDHHQSEIEEKSKDFDVVTESVVIADHHDDVCDEGPEGIGILPESMESMTGDANGEKGEVITRVDQGVHGDDDVCVEGSEILGIFSELTERVNIEEKSEKCETFTIFDQVDDERMSKKMKVDDGRVNEDAKVMLCNDVVIGVCGNDGEKVSKNIIGFPEMEREVVEGKSEDINFDESFGVKEENVVVGGMDRLIAEVKIKHEEFEDRSDLEGLIAEGKIENQDVTGNSNVKLEGDDVAIGLKDESGVVGYEGNQGGLSTGDDEKAAVTNKQQVDDDDDDDDDDWEGIESTELEKRFGEAVNYVECGAKGKDDQLASLGSDVQMQLYGLHKIAVEGTCHEPPPMALNFSARAKWNVWQKLGSMSREAAMEDYIKLLSENVPGWVQHYSIDDGKQVSTESRTLDPPHSENLFQDIQSNIISERELELNYASKADDANVGAKAE